jgi:hypothetical protein
MTLRVKNFIRPALVTACILLLPLVGNQFTDGEGWSASDFVVAGTLIFVTGFLVELIASLQSTMQYRLAAGLALAAGFLSLWVNLAVGIIGGGPNLANLMFGGVYLTVLIGAFMVRMRPQGMALTMMAAALVQFLAPLVALLFWKPEFTPDITRGLVGNMLFVALWLGSAWLFRRADNHGFKAGSSVSAAA